MMDTGEVTVPRLYLFVPPGIVSHEACVVTATVSDIRDMDESLIGQLTLWPYFRKATESDGGFMNYCTRCGEPQEDLLLHSEPELPFFDVSAAIASGEVTCTSLMGTIRLNGDAPSRID
jgi:hypothetical protein